MDSGQLSEVVFSTLVLARAETIRGEVEQARRLFEEVGARAREHGISSLDSHSQLSSDFSSSRKADWNKRSKPWSGPCGSRSGSVSASP